MRALDFVVPFNKSNCEQTNLVSSLDHYSPNLKLGAILIAAIMQSSNTVSSLPRKVHAYSCSFDEDPAAPVSMRTALNAASSNVSPNSGKGNDAPSPSEQEREGYDGDDLSDDENGGGCPSVGSNRRKEKFGMRKACERCRQRKNKCDGSFPCGMCVKSFQEIQAAGGICLFSSPEEMCVRHTRKPMSRTSSRHSNGSKNSTSAVFPPSGAAVNVTIPLETSLMFNDRDGIRVPTAHVGQHQGYPFARPPVDAIHVSSLQQYMDTNQKWNPRDQVLTSESAGVPATDESDAEGWNAPGISQGLGASTSQGFFIDEFTVSPAQSAQQHGQLMQSVSQNHPIFMHRLHEPRQHHQSRPLSSLAAHREVVDGIAYKTFHELSWLALELCEPLSSISLLFWRSLHQIDVPQWLSTRCLLACCNIRCDSQREGSVESATSASFGRCDSTVAADHHRLLQLAVIIHGCSCSNGEGEQVCISRDALILLDSMIVRLAKKVLSRAKAAARGDDGSFQMNSHTSIRLPGNGGTFIANQPPDFTVVTAINVFVSLCCAIGCVSAFSTTPDEDYDAIMSTLSALCHRYAISLESIRSTFPYLTNVTDINLQYAFGEEIMQSLMQGSAHLLQADSLVTKLFCCDSFVLRLLARATCFKLLERFHTHTSFLPNDPPCIDPVHVFEEIGSSGDHRERNSDKERLESVGSGGGLLSGDYSLAMLFGARHCMSRQLSLSQALGLNAGPAPPVFDLAAAGQHMEAIERIKKYFYTFMSIRQQKGVGSRSSATFFWFKWSLDAVSAVMLYKADVTSGNCHLSDCDPCIGVTITDQSLKRGPGNDHHRDAALLSSLSSLVQEIVGLRQSMLFLMEPSAAAALAVIITIVMAQRARSPAYEEIWKSLSVAVSSAATSSVSGNYYCATSTR